MLSDRHADFVFVNVRKVTFFLRKVSMQFMQEKTAVNTTKGTCSMLNKHIQLLHEDSSSLVNI